MPNETMTRRATAAARRRVLRLMGIDDDDDAREGAPVWEVDRG